MIERGEHTRFAFEARQPIAITGEGRGQDLDRDVAPEFRIARAIDLAHPSRPNRGEDVVRANRSTDQRLTGSAAHGLCSHSA